MEDFEGIVGGKRYALGYRFRDYGKLSLSVMKRLEECGTIHKAPRILEEIRKFYKLSNLVGPSLRIGGSFTRWMIDGECSQIGVLDVQIDKQRKKKVFFGTTGVLFLKSAFKSSNIAKSFEDLIVLRVLAEKMRNLSLVLRAIQSKGSINCYCSKVRGKEIRKLNGKMTLIESKTVPTTLSGAFLIHCESPQVIPSAISSNNPMAVSGLVYNEIYQVYHALRTVLQLWINESSKSLTGLVTLNPYEISDRMGREITRGFDKLGLLHSLRGRTRYTSLPDRLLSDLVAYFGEVALREASLNGMVSPKQLPLISFIKMMKEEFRILINPNDVIEFLGDFVNHKNLGIDLKIARGYLISNYYRFTERLETLGLATIRPDGDVMIRVE